MEIYPILHYDLGLFYNNVLDYLVFYQLPRVMVSITHPNMSLVVLIQLMQYEYFFGCVWSVIDFLQLVYCSLTLKLYHLFYKHYSYLSIVQVQEFLVQSILFQNYQSESIFLYMNINLNEKYKRILINIHYKQRSKAKMERRKVQDPQTARFIRKKHKGDGQDQQEDQQDEVFYKDPSKALNRHAKQRTQRNIQKQVQYFGNVIQPFHMRQQEQLGQIDEQGFFVFNRKNKQRDAWLESIGQADDNQVADQLVKRIKKQSRFQSVYEAGQGLNKNLNQNQQQQQGQNQEYQGGGIEQAPQSQQQSQNKLNIQQLIQLILLIIPPQVTTNANNYMKKLKKQKKMDQYNKLLTVSNEYIQKTGQYDILTKKRQQLEDMLADIVEAQRIKNTKGEDIQAKFKEAQEKVLDWDNDSSSNQKQKQHPQNNQAQTKKVQENLSDSNSNQSGQENDNDDIF